MPSFKDALYSEISTLPSAGVLTGAEVLYANGASAGAQLTAEAIKPLVVEDPFDITSLSLSVHNPQLGNNPSYRRMAEFNMTTDCETSVPDFSNENGVAIGFRAINGQANYRTDVGTLAKKTFMPLTVNAIYNASGQKFACNFSVVGYGMSDTAVFANNSVYYAGGPIAGDEGQGFATFSHLSQFTNLILVTITAIATPSTMDTTTTQSIVRSIDPQTVTVVSTTGAAAGQWVVVEQDVPHGFPNTEAVQIITVDSATSFTAVFRCNHFSGVPVKPALVMSVDNASVLGQDRYLINKTVTPYTTGTAGAHLDGGGFTTPDFDGVGTSWSVGMVGGYALNIGAIALEADTYSVTPFNGPEGVYYGPLRSWHQIQAINSATSMTIHSFSVAGHAMYKGLSRSQGAYVIRPSVKVLRLGTTGGSYTGEVICENSTSTWTVGDLLEQAICPYPDVTGWQYSLAQFTPCGTIRGFMLARNGGAQRFGYGFACDASGGIIPGAQGENAVDTVAWGSCFQGTFCDYGVTISQCRTAALKCDFDPPTGLGVFLNRTIEWGNGSFYLAPWNDGSNSGFEWVMAVGGLLKTFGATASQAARLKFQGAFQTGSGTAATQLPAASSTFLGCVMTVTDCNHTTWGNAVVGGGSNTVLAFCNGAAWTVIGK